MQPVILIVDDDRAMTELLQRQLEKPGYRVVAAWNGRDGLRAAAQEQPDLVILDVRMPGMDGWEVCRRLREISNVPIMMLTASSATREVVRGLRYGADDYIVKPFKKAELQARVAALLRRSPGASNSGSAAARSYDDGYLTIDLDQQRVMVQGKPIPLTPTEYGVLSCLVRNEGRTVPLARLLAEVWGPESIHQSDYPKLYIRYLRRKIEPDPADPVYIHTMWREGYYFKTTGLSVN